MNLSTRLRNPKKIFLKIFREGVWVWVVEEEAAAVEWDSEIVSEAAFKF
jgi:hypothetical protein